MIIIAALLILYVYVIAVTVYTKSVLISLSDTYYKLNEEDLGWIFQILLVVLSGCLITEWIDRTPEEYQFLPFISIASVLFVAAAPRFLERIEGRVHYVSAGIAVISSLIWCLLQDNRIECIPPAIIFGTAILLFRKSWGLFIELMMFSCVAILLLLR